MLAVRVPQASPDEKLPVEIIGQGAGQEGQRDIFEVQVPAGNPSGSEEGAGTESIIPNQDAIGLALIAALIVITVSFSRTLGRKRKSK
jgi:hypothetical protein